MEQTPEQRFSQLGLTLPPAPTPDRRIQALSYCGQFSVCIWSWYGKRR